MFHAAVCRTHMHFLLSLLCKQGRGPHIGMSPFMTFFRFLWSFPFEPEWRHCHMFMYVPTARVLQYNVIFFQLQKIEIARQAGHVVMIFLFSSGWGALTSRDLCRKNCWRWIAKQMSALKPRYTLNSRRTARLCGTDAAVHYPYFSGVLCAVHMSPYVEPGPLVHPSVCILAALHRLLKCLTDLRQIKCRHSLENCVQQSSVL
jgi:hypothetical protein